MRPVWHSTAAAAAMVLALATGAFATPVSFRTAASGVDWTSAGVAGTGGGVR
jgi:hypothetical protein